MRDEAAIRNFARYPQGGDRAIYCFGDTSVLAEEWTENDGRVHLRPIGGDQVACGEWNDLDEADTAAYCELLEDEMRRRETV